jgi:histidinol-phosphate/aromatic aminotransferase/cobyric acid decarboxylase-like protein/choline kinase
MAGQRRGIRGDMRAIILAAGLGRRMMPLTENVHKTLLSVGGRPIIDRLICGLKESGIFRITIVTGYRADELESYVRRRFPDLELSFVRNDLYESTNNIHSLALAFEQLDFTENIVLLESDLIFEPAVLRRLIASKHENVAVVDRYRVGLDGTVVALSDSKVVTHVIPASLQGSNFDFSDKYKTLNIYKFSAEFCRTTFSRLLSYYNRIIDNNCYYELILGILIYMQQAQIHAVTLNGELWAEVDDPNDLRNAEFVFAPQHRRRHLENSWGGYWNTPILDFAFIRNMHFPPDSMVSQLMSNLSKLMTNYGSTQSLLNEKLANYLRCKPENVHFLNGASQFFPILRRYFVGRRVLLPTPTFGEYPRAFPDAATYADDGRFSVREVFDRADDSDLIVVVRPNNPTGTTATSEDLQDVIRSADDKTVLVDESFIDFSDQPSLIPWLEQEDHSNVIVLKSLSKVLGVPGLRIGFVHTTDPIWAERIQSELPVWNVNSVAEHFIELLLKYPAELPSSFKQSRLDREALSQELSRLGVVEQVFASGGNFLLTKLRVSEEDADVIADTLLIDHGIYVKSVSSKFVDGGTYWRIAVRTADENSQFCDALHDATQTALADRNLVGSVAADR